MSTREDAEKFFDCKDADNSGCLSLSELKDALKNNGYSSAQIEDFFTQINLDGDANVTKEEWLTYMGHCAPEVHAEATKKRFFLQFDKDADGQITRDELKNAMAECGCEWSDEETERIMAQFDDDGSSTLSISEFIEVIYGPQD